MHIIGFCVFEIDSDPKNWTLRLGSSNILTVVQLKCGLDVRNVAAAVLNRSVKLVYRRVGFLR